MECRECEWCLCRKCLPNAHMEISFWDIVCDLVVGNVCSSSCHVLEEPHHHVVVSKGPLFAQGHATEQVFPSQRPRVAAVSDKASVSVQINNGLLVPGWDSNADEVAPHSCKLESANSMATKSAVEDATHACIDVVAVDKDDPVDSSLLAVPATVLLQKTVFAL